MKGSREPRADHELRPIVKQGVQNGPAGSANGDTTGHDVRLDFIRPGKPVENAFIESFNGKLRDECLNSHVFGSVTEAQEILDAWRDDYNLVRPHSSLQDRTPAAVGAMWVDSRDPRESTATNETGIKLEITGRFVTISPS